jgi:hypothetical protein
LEAIKKALGNPGIVDGMTPRGEDAITRSLHDASIGD